MAEPRLSVVEDLGRQREASQVERSTQRLAGDTLKEMDEGARDVAYDAKFKIESHERVCTERWEQARLAGNRVEAAMGKLQDAMDERIGKVPAGIIAGLTGLVGFLAARAFPLH